MIFVYPFQEVQSWMWPASVLLAGFFVSVFHYLRFLRRRPDAPELSRLHTFQNLGEVAGYAARRVVGITAPLQGRCVYLVI